MVLDSAQWQAFMKIIPCLWII